MKMRDMSCEKKNCNLFVMDEFHVELECSVCRRGYGFFTDSYKLTVEDGQYLEIFRCFITERIGVR